MANKVRAFSLKAGTAVDRPWLQQAVADIILD
jgi:hypothetical protein